ncbi:MAG: hypothetical protein A2428_09810 [Bdellovibrionales bacterium RIFOXYC1_FULL_54_43]|nr:MAG: hypothetical protein A2428_09810 [Bdellovibrionales bacterium RIFOXYC1_FULL_54_43]OFZ83342.1 MAG: hypothetical protein A2603_06735 [Bdellovibrionales bacterium RIFOXYD1_FULL_55_31]
MIALPALSRHKVLVLVAMNLVMVSNNGSGLSAAWGRDTESNARVLSGIVVGLTRDNVELRSGGEVITFKRGAKLRSDTIKLGDRVTVYFSMNAHKIQKSPGEAGEAAPSGVPGVPGVIDDRAFYNARNDH